MPMNVVARTLRFLAIALLGPFTPWTFAALLWEHTTVEQAVPVGKDLVEIAFPFSNSGKLPVTIIAVQSSCPCTTARLEKMNYTPGEKGSLVAIFNAAGLVGIQEKTIQVISDESPAPTTLTLHITIPPWVEVSPRLVGWPVGAEPKSKEILVSIVPSANATITSVTTADPSIQASYSRTEEPGRYRLLIQPRSTEKPSLTMVILHLEAPGAAARTYPVFAQVR